MRIISKFRDYYDGVSRYAPGDTPVWVRNEKRDDIKNVALPEISGVTGSWCRFEDKEVYGMRATPFVVGFCGKYHTGIYLDDYGYRPDPTAGVRLPDQYSVEDKFHAAGSEYSTYKTTRWIFHHPDEFDNFNKRLGRKGIDFGKGARARSRLNDFSYKNWTEWKTNIEKIDATPAHLATGSPVLSICRDQFVTNTELRKFAFYRRFDALRAYQEIDMFLNGPLSNPEFKDAAISDADKRDTHGFNEWSFKTRPGSKKPRRKS